MSTNEEISPTQEVFGSNPTKLENVDIENVQHNNLGKAVEYTVTKGENEVEIDEKLAHEVNLTVVIVYMSFSIFCMAVFLSLF